MGVGDERNLGKLRLYMGATVALGAVFMVVKAFEYRPSSTTGAARYSNFMASYFTFTGLHMLHVLAGWGSTSISGSPAPRYGDQPGVVRQPGGDRRPLLAFRRPGVDLPLPDALPAQGGSWRADHAAAAHDHVDLKSTSAPT